MDECTLNADGYILLRLKQILPLLPPHHQSHAHQTLFKVTTDRHLLFAEARVDAAFVGGVADIAAAQHTIETGFRSARVLRGAAGVIAGVNRIQLSRLLAAEVAAVKSASRIDNMFSNKWASN